MFGTLSKINDNHAACLVNHGLGGGMVFKIPGYKAQAMQPVDVLDSGWSVESLVVRLSQLNNPHIMFQICLNI